MDRCTHLALVGIALLFSACTLDRSPRTYPQRRSPEPSVDASAGCPTDCDDSDPCTLDLCSAGLCEHSLLPGCSVDAGLETSGPSDAASSVSDSSFDSGGPREPPRCVTEGSQVVALGDSYVTYLPGISITPILVSRAVASNALRPGDSYRDYAQPGAVLGIPGVPAIRIASQLEQALRVNPDIRAIYLTGGGGDILIGPAECREPGAASAPLCRSIVMLALSSARELLTAAADAGVRDVIYFFYPYLREGLPLSGRAANELLDYAYPLAQALCDDAERLTGGATRCHFIDLRPVFAGHTQEWINGIDGVHTTPPGAVAIGDAIWDRMERECIARPPASGCCEL